MGPIAATSASRGALVAHRAAPPRAALHVDVAVDLRAGVLEFAFDVRGDVGAISLPEKSRAPARRDRLWEHTCFEAFLATAEGSVYLEVNLSPSGDWALWAFDAYRAGMRAAPLERAPDLALDWEPSPVEKPGRTARELRVTASLPLIEVASHLGGPPARIGLAAVIEESDGYKSYWACRHPADRPDFHRREGWTIAVYPPVSP